MEKSENPKFNRSQFLGALAATALTGSLCRPKNGAGGNRVEAADSPGALDLRLIPASGKGKTPEKIPAVGMGSSRTFDHWPLGDAKERELTGVLETFFGMGGTILDSSPMYGTSERVLGHLTKKIAPQPGPFWATKVWTSSLAEGKKQYRESTDFFHSQTLDLWQIHNLVNYREFMPLARKYKEEGKIRYWGITHYVESALDDLATLIKKDRPDFVQLNFSVIEKKAIERTIPLARDLGCAVMVNRPFARGGVFRRVPKAVPEKLARAWQSRGWGELFLRYVLSFEGVTCVIPATSKVKHMRDNMRANTPVSLAGAELKKARQLLEAYF